MDAKEIEAMIQKSKKRNFKQTIELIINLKKSYDLNKAENKFTEYFELPKGKGKKSKIAAIVGPELEKSAKEIFDFVLVKDNIKDLGQNKREIKKIAKKYYIFVAQSSVMPDVGKFLGRYLAARNKMPNPKYGMIFPDNITPEFLKNLYEKMQKMVRITIKNHITFGIIVGSEDMSPDDIKENINAVIGFLINRIPGGKNSIKSIYLKQTMSKSIKVSQW
ncbi:50S ribosomal protein L1 [Nanobdella aerobiophila]|uniref:50S ribosomal protein L1 n=1 Tax=Nanobdella aerobiophila TaxID=2586965 RepID=A0A915S9V9_9ARCH|nr:50S ribosomal protein L1 [Nanobdella aerobiophila]BBL45307.1 50S ribosomal protein L1 [Nanobdella aerobiophila]